MALRSSAFRSGCLFTACAVVGLSAPAWAQEPTPDVSPEPSSAQAPVGSAAPSNQAAPVQPNVTGKTYGGKAATSAVIKEQTKQRREAAKAVPKTGEWRQDWLKGPSALGDWAGYRQQIEDAGISLSGFSITDIMGNVTGGNRRSTAAASFNLLALDLDFGRLASLPGFLIHAEGWGARGNNPSTRGRINNLLGVAQAYTPSGFYLGQLYAELTLFDNALMLQAGRMATSNNFATLPVALNYVSVANNPIPISLPINTVPFTNYPHQWAAVGTLTPMPQIQVTGGVYNGDRRSSRLKATNGLDWTFQPQDGIMGVGQISLLLNQGAGDTGLPGIYYFGGFYNTNDYERLNGSGDKGSNYGFYWMAQQMIYREGGPESSEGLTPWLAIAYQPQDSINLLPVYVAGGLVYEGLVPGRDIDTMALAVYHAEVSNALPNTTGETVVEVNYTYWALPWLGLTPDFQYVFNPNGGGSNDDVAVFGGQILVNF
jgi:porin